MNITLFGGSFNPPHLGHLIVIQQAFELISRIDKIWLLPDYQHAFAKNNRLAPASHRLAMAKMLTNRHVKLQSCTFDQKMPGNTIFHLKYLQNKYPDHSFSFLLGSDNLPAFHQWPEYQTLLRLMPFYIYPRAEFPFKPLYPNMHPLTHPQQIITNISSTLIRQRLKQKLTVNHLVPKKISRYISSNNLYL